MLAVSVEFLLARYHATAWGRAANEGDVEWPPSPWRLGRALVSAWYRLGPDRRPDESQLDKLLQLIATPPRFVLPHASVGHTRHYMPEGGSKATSPPAVTSSPVLDTFVRVASPHVVAVWDDVDVDGVAREHLQVLLDGVSYLGRAESPCIARIVDDFPATTLSSEPFDEAVGAANEDVDVVNVLCLDTAATKAALSESTAERRKRRLDSPPAGRWVSYARPRRALEPLRPSTAAARRPQPIHVMRFGLDGPALPPVTEALRVAELFRAAALSRAGAMKILEGDAEAVARLRGRSADDDRPMEGHRHCHYLATDEDGDGRLDHFTVWCPAGLGAGERAALDVEALTSNWRLKYPLRVVLLESRTGADPPEDGPTATAVRWSSHTPFVPTRHPKRRGGVLTDGFDDQVVAELRHRGLPLPESVQLRPPGRRSWGAYRHQRDTGRRQRHDLPALGWTIVFPKPVRGPICLGRHSHFGLGLFLPDDRD